MPTASVESYVSQKVGEALTILRSEMTTKMLVSEENNKGWKDQIESLKGLQTLPSQIEELTKKMHQLEELSHESVRQVQSERKRRLILEKEHDTMVSEFSKVKQTV